ncbi:MAG TPA: MbcA/ParS/Xre antitoxin family protein [Terracidiphilus sp.]|nr:MbcA/ParS/Xre antitoxin family protein [Terracidiphilus sp.]
MATLPNFAAAGYRFETVPDLSRLETRERLSQSAVEGLFRIAEKWRVSPETVGELLGGVPRSSVYKLRSAAGTLRQDELTRISYVVGIYKALHILLPDDLADRWMTQPNDYFLFAGQTPLGFVLRMGIPGLQQVRSYLDAARGGL